MRGDFLSIIVAPAIFCLIFLLHWRSALRADLPRIAAAAVSLLALAGCESYDPGGDVMAASRSMFEAQAQGKPVEIRGMCYSACALKLGSGAGLCVAPSARIGVHEVRRVASPWDYRQGVRDELATGYFAGLLPMCARTAFSARHGFDSGSLVVLSGGELLSACPDMRPCAA